MLAGSIQRLFRNRNQTWTFYAQLVRILSGIAFIGLMTRALSSDLLGTWYIFVSLFGVASLLEMGLGQVIGRHAAYMKSDYDLGKISSDDFFKFAKVGEQFYLALTLAIGLVAATAGLWWIGNAHAELRLSPTLIAAWLAYVGGGMLAICGAYYAALVNGVGEMWQAQRITIFAAGLNIAVLLTFFIFPAILLIPAAAILVSQLLAVILLRRTLFDLAISKTCYNRDAPTQIDSRRLVCGIAKDSARMVLIMAYYQLLTNGFMLILSKYLGPQQIASYGIAMQFVGVVMSISMVWSHSNFFEMAATRQSGDLSALRKIFFDGTIRSLTVSSIGMIGIYFIGPIILSILGSKTDLPGWDLLKVMLFTIWVEFGLTLFSQMLIARGDMRVAYFSLSAAALICLATLYLLSNGYSLVEVFALRLVLYVVFIGFPVLFMSQKIFSQTRTRKKVLDEAA